MKTPKFFAAALIAALIIVNLATAQRAPYVAPKPTVQNLINSKDWSFVENKGQLSESEKQSEERSNSPTRQPEINNSDIKYYSHSGGVNLYCRPGKISFVFTKVEPANEGISE